MERLGETAPAENRTRSGDTSASTERRVCAPNETARLFAALPSLTVFAITHAAGIKVAEAGFLLLVIAGIWFVAAEIPALGLRRVRMIVGGTALAGAGVLLIVATHWGHFG